MSQNRSHTLVLLFMAFVSFSCETRSIHVPRLPLDAENDYEVSPYTGWTRSHYLVLFTRLLDGFIGNLSVGGARTLYDGSGELPAGMEGVTRMLPALGAWLANLENPALVDLRGTVVDIESLATEALLHGTDPEHPEYWGDIVQGWDQRTVEAALVAEFLLDTRARIWEMLNEHEQAQIMTWLAPANDQLSANWRLFQVARNTAREVLGFRVDAVAFGLQLDGIDSEYLSDGFYYDAYKGRVDYYNAFVVHPGSILWMQHLGDSDPVRRSRLETRLGAFLFHFPYFFSSGGAPVMFGRSIAYRSAVVSPVVDAYLAGYSTLSAGLSRRIVSGNLSFHLGHDLRSVDYMLDDGNVVTRGFIGEDPRVLENYIRPGSQYYVTRALKVLSLPSNDPFWMQVEEPLPADIGSFDHALPALGFTLVHHYDDGAVTLLNAGLSSEDEKYYSKYKKLMYSSRFPFDVGEPGSARPYDSAVTVSADLSFSAGRSAPIASSASVGFAQVVYDVPSVQSPGVSHRVATATMAEGGDILRVSCVTPGAEAAHVFEGGFPVPGDVEWNQRSSNGRHWIYGRTSWGTVVFAGLHGFSRVSLQEGLEDDRSLNSVWEDSLFPSLSTAEPLDKEACLVSAWMVNQGLLRDIDVMQNVQDVTVGIDGTRVNVSFGDGRQIFADVEPSGVQTVEVGSLEFSGPLRYASTNPRESYWRASGVTLVRSTAVDVVVAEMDDAATNLSCTDMDGAMRCETDVSGQFLVDGPSRVYGLRVDGTWRDLTKDVTFAKGVVTIPEHVHREQSLEQSLGVATYEFRSTNVQNKY